MNIDIRENIISSIKTETDKSLVAIIDEATLSDDELVLPGMGVILSLFWGKFDKEEKLNIANHILEKIKRI